MHSPSFKDLFKFYFDSNKMRPRFCLPYAFEDLQRTLDALPPNELFDAMSTLFRISPDNTTLPQWQKELFTAQLGELMDVLSKVNNQAQKDLHKSNEDQNRSIAQFQQRLSGHYVLEPEMIRDYYLYCIFNPHSSNHSAVSLDVPTVNAYAGRATKEPNHKPAFLDLPYYGPRKPVGFNNPFDLRNTILILTEEIRISGWDSYHQLAVLPQGGVLFLEILQTTAPIWTAVQYSRRTGNETKTVTDVFQWITKIIAEKTDVPILLKHVGKTIENHQFLSAKVYYRKKRRGEKL